ncbi:MAG: MFS transporter [Spirochaetae bacterium HGW-Spirochaetae-5]|nr:MAG: MFS transporter [Spirochaetae bacterium HGW-Spirochaetae-5]
MKTDILFFNKQLQIVFAVTLIAVMEISCIAPVLPGIAEALSITAGETNLLIVVFTMPGIVLAPFFGIAADRFGRKNVLVPALLLFGICGTAAGFTDSFSLLLILRFFQGAGAASLGSLNQTIIGDIFPGKERVTAMGYNSSVLSVGTMLYPSIGGAVAMLGWHYPFFLAAMAFPVSLLVIIGLNYKEPVKNGDIKEYLKQSFRLMKKKDIISLYIGTLAAFILLYGILLAFFPFYMKNHFQASPLIIGLAMSTSSIGAIIGSFNLGKLAGIFSSKKLLVTAYLIYPVALATAYFMPSILLFIIANGILIPNIQTQISILAPDQYRGAFMSINSSVLRLGQTIGPLLSGIIITRLGEGYVFIFGAIFAISAAFFVSYGVREMGRLERR